MSYYYQEHTVYYNVSASLLTTWVGLPSQFPLFSYFLDFLALLKHSLTIEYHVSIQRVSPHLSCGATCQIWVWFNESNSYFCTIENYAYGEMN